MSTTDDSQTTDPRAELKAMARRLRRSLGDRGVDVGHSEALELIAHQHGVRDWNTLAATGPASTGSDPAAAFGPVIPILRIFDVAKAREFYQEFLGFTVDWEHTYDDRSPVYVQASRGGALLHLSEHHGDASPGATVRILTADVRRLHRELHGRKYQYAKPGLETEPWGLEVTVIDPFANRLVFHQLISEGPTEGGGAAAGPIEHVFAVACAPAQAFEAFTGAIGTWWHPAYAPPGLADVTMAPDVGGVCLMRTQDGSELTWGTVTDWDPPSHYGQTFTLAQDSDHPSRLDVWFDPAPAGTRMRLSHGGWTPGNMAGRAKANQWPVVIERFVAYAEGRPLPMSDPGA